MYTSARSPPHHGVASLAPFLPQARTTYYPTSPNPPPLPPSVHSPNSLRRERGASSKNGRPFSADVGRLLSVQEGSENGDEARAKVKGHRRSSSYGSDPAMSGRSVGEKRGNSYQNLHSRPLSHEEYYCEYFSPYFLTMMTMMIQQNNKTSTTSTMPTTKQQQLGQ